MEPVLELEPEKEKPSTASRSRCLRSSAPGQAKRKLTKKRRICTQDMIKGGTYWLDESTPESIEDGCLLLVIMKSQTLQVNPLLDNRF